MELAKRPSPPKKQLTYDSAISSLTVSTETLQRLNALPSNLHDAQPIVIRGSMSMRLLLTEIVNRVNLLHEAVKKSAAPQGLTTSST